MTIRYYIYEGYHSIQDKLSSDRVKAIAITLDREVGNEGLSNMTLATLIRLIAENKGYRDIDVSEVFQELLRVGFFERIET